MFVGILGFLEPLHMLIDSRTVDTCYTRSGASGSVVQYEHLVSVVRTYAMRTIRKGPSRPAICCDCNAARHECGYSESHGSSTRLIGCEPRNGGGFAARHHLLTHQLYLR